MGTFTNGGFTLFVIVKKIFRPKHNIFENYNLTPLDLGRDMRFPTMWYVLSKGSDQPAHMHSLIRAFASRLSIK